MSEHLIAKIKKIRNDLKDVYEEVVSQSIQEPPRPLSKGDWVMVDNEYLVYVMVAPTKILWSEDYFFVGVTVSGAERKYMVKDCTRIDTLTEEHLRLLNDDTTTFTLRKDCENEYYVIEQSNFHKNTYCVYTDPAEYDHIRKSKVIKYTVKSVISRRRFDREMGV